MLIASPLPRSTVAALLTSCLILISPASADDAAFNAAIVGMEADDGAVTIYGNGDETLVAVTPEVFGRDLFWSAETTRYPPGAVSIAGSLIAANMIRLEQQGSRVLIRSLSTGAVKVAGNPDDPLDHIGMSPVDLAVDGAQLGPILAALPILAQRSDGTLLLDITALFSDDIQGFSSVPQLIGTGFKPSDVDPSRSFIAGARAFTNNLYIRSQLTFEGLDDSDNANVVTIEVGHTIALLPDPPMQARLFDPRVGYFTTDTLAFETADGAPTETKRISLRQRLERPAGAPDGIVDPVEPLVYYIGPDVPERWRPYIAQGIEDWQIAFEAAGFSNAIVARQAPTPEEDPNWAEEDVSFNVVRWLAQPYDNAQGQQVHDPRSGEIISAHILVWPQVFDFFANYYYAEASGNDPRAQSFPFSDDLMGEVIRYVVAHEVGHTLGLRHNQRATTAWTVEQLRNPAFVAENGSVASIMSYGRMNYVAQPEDGIERILPVIGPYDLFAIEWGYGPNLDAAGLAAIASRQVGQPELRWSAGEMPDEQLALFDPTVQTEAIGADRVASTRLGLATFAASLARLPAATQGLEHPEVRMRAVYDLILARQRDMLIGTVKIAGGLIENRAPGGSPVPTYTPTTPVETRDAIAFVMSEGITSLEVFLDPDLLASFRPLGGAQMVSDAAAQIVSEALYGPKLQSIHAANRQDTDRNFDISDYLEAITDALTEGVTSIETAQAPRQAALIQYIGMLNGIIASGDDDDLDQRAEYMKAGVDPALAVFLTAGLTATGADDAAQAQVDRLMALLGGGKNAVEDNPE